MKTAIKLALVYLAMQIFSAFIVTPFAMFYAYFVYGDKEQATGVTLAPMLLLGFILMTIYLWKQGYLTGDKQLYSPVSVSFLLWSLVMGLSIIFLLSVLFVYLTFLPDWMANTFDILQTGWLGIICLTILGPILEELLFRGAITKVLLKKYSPAVAILISGIIFGIFHMNPAQVVSAMLIGFFLAWIYYKTHSLIPCILIHIMNNSISVYLNIKYPDQEITSDGLWTPAFVGCVVLAIVMLILSLRMMNTYKLPDTTTEV